MLLEEALRVRLTTSNTSAQERIFPMRMPQDKSLEFPLIVYQRISAPRMYAHDGDAKLPYIRTQWSGWGKSYDEVVALMEEVKIAFSGYTNEAEGIQSCFLAFEFEDWDEQSGLFRRMVDTLVGYKGN